MKGNGMNNFEKASLSSIGGGLAIKQFDYQLQQAIDNCNDPNTDPAAVRTVTLKVTIKPSADRREALMSFQATSKLAPDIAGIDHLFIANGQGYVQDTEQLAFDVMNEEQNVMQMKEGTNNVD